MPVHPGAFAKQPPSLLQHRNQRDHHLPLCPASCVRVHNPTGGHFSPHRWPRISPPSGFSDRQSRGLTPFAGGRLREPVAVGAVCDSEAKAAENWRESGLPTSMRRSVLARYRHSPASCSSGVSPKSSGVTPFRTFSRVHLLINAHRPRVSPRARRLALFRLDRSSGVLTEPVLVERRCLALDPPGNRAESPTLLVASSDASWCDYRRDRRRNRCRHRRATRLDYERFLGSAHPATAC
jgi:hypothetical protein